MPRIAQAAIITVLLMGIIRAILAVDFLATAFTSGVMESNKYGQYLFGFIVQIGLAVILVTLGFRVVCGNRGVRFWLLAFSLVGIAGPTPQFLWIPMVLCLAASALLLTRPVRKVPPGGVTTGSDQIK